MSHYEGDEAPLCALVKRCRCAAVARVSTRRPTLVYHRALDREFRLLAAVRCCLAFVLIAPVRSFPVVVAIRWRWLGFITEIFGGFGDVYFINWGLFCYGFLLCLFIFK